MATLVRVSAAVGMALGAWLSLGALAGTTESATTGRIGILPSIVVLLASGAAAALAAFAARPKTDRLLPACFLIILVLPWLPGSLPPAFLIWGGPLALFVWLAVALAVVAALKRQLPRTMTEWLRSPRRAVVVAACVAFVAYAAAAHRLHRNGLIPGGDEPHYLVITQSLLLDGDLRIENNHQRSDYRTYIGVPLEPDYARRGSNGQIYSIHAPGLPLLLTPAFALAGYPGAVWCLSFVAAMGTALAWYAGFRLTGSPTAAWFGWASTALSTSFFFHAFAIYPEVIASVVLLVTVWALTFTLAPLQWVGLGGAIALLPWLHSRFAVLALALGLCAAERMLRRPDRLRCLAAFLVVPATSALAWVGFFWAVYGTPSPAAPYGPRSPIGLEYLGRGLVGLLFDQQFGLLAHAPVYLVALAGLCLMIARRRQAPSGATPHRRMALQIVAVGVPYACVVAGFPMWWAGASAPARFLVPLLLPLSIPAAVAWAVAERRATRSAAFTLLALSVAVTCTLLIADGGWLLFNVRDGYSRLWDWASPLADVSVGLPSLFRHTPLEALGRVAVWLGASILAWLAVRAFDAGGSRQVGALGLAILTTGSLCIAVSLSVAWVLEQAPVTRPTASATRLLRTYDARLHRWAVRYDAAFGRAVSFADPRVAHALDGLRLDWESRRPPRAGQKAWLGPLPAGDYRVRFEMARPAEGALVLIVGRHDTALGRWDLGGLRPGAHERVVRLPLPVIGLVIRTEPPADDAVSRVTLVPSSLLARGGVREELALQALRVGDRSAFLLNEGAYFEPSGFWVRPGRPAAVAFASGDGRSVVRLGIRNAPVPNTLDVRAGSWRQSLELAPGEERLLEVPARPRETVTVVEFLSQRGFQPVLVDPSNRDNRWLGCWVEMR